MFTSLDRLGHRTDTGKRPAAALGTTRLPSRTLVELIGQANLQAIQDAFATAFDIPTVVLDHDGYNVSEITHRVALCEDLTRPSRAGANCLKCDRSGMATSAVTHRPTIFHCWNDLWDCTVPIVSSRGELFGYFLSGQVFFEPQSGLARYRATAAEHGIDPEKYVAAAAAVRVMPREIYVRGIECIAVLARMIADQASAVLQQRELLDTLLAATAQTQRLAAEVDTIARAASQVGGALAEGMAAVGRLCDSIERVIACDSVIIFRLEEDQTLRPVVVRDPYPEAISRWSVPVGTGIVGTVAATGEAMQVDDVTSHPLFVAIPGVPVEAEALVALPLEHAGSVVGVLQVSRLRRRTFSVHEHDLLRILALNVAVALGTSSLRAEAARYRQAAAAYRALAERASAGASTSELCDLVLTQADSLLATTRTALRMTLAEGEDRTATLHMTVHALRAAERRHAEALQRVRDRERSVVVGDKQETLLICSIGSGEPASGALMLWRREPFSALERDIAETLAQQTGISLRDRWQQRQARALQTRSGRLAELVRASARASSPREVAAALSHAHELVDGAMMTVVVLRGPAPGVLDLWQRRGGELNRRELSVAGRPDLRFPASSSGEAEPGLFDAWGRAVIAEASPETTVATLATVALPGADEPWGGLLLGVRNPPSRPERASLHVLADVAASSLETLGHPRPGSTGRASHETELAALHDVALSLLGAGEPPTLARRICTALGDLAGTDHVILQLREPAGGRPATFAAPRLTRDSRRHLLELGRRWADRSAPILEGRTIGLPFAVSDGARGLLIADACRNACDQVVLRTFAGYAALALGRARETAQARSEARTYERAVQTGAGREGRLHGLLDADVELITAGLAGGLQPLVRTLARLLGAEVAIYDTERQRMAGTDEHALRPENLVEPRAARASAEVPAGNVIAIRQEQEDLGWLHVGATEPPPDPRLLRIAASSAAVALLQARAAGEAEARVRRDFVEALLTTERPSDTLARHGQELGHDPTLAARVAVATADGCTGADLHRLLSGWARSHPDVLIAQRAEELVLLGPAHGDWPEGLRATLSAAGPGLHIGVGGSTDIRGYRESHLGASRAVAALRRLGRSGLISIDGEGLEQLLLRAAEPELLAAFVLRVLGPLESYDRERGAEMRRTLELCVQHGWNLQASARAAHLHHSTLRYRLRRIAALTGLDPQRPDDRLAVELALMADRLLRE